MPQRKKADGKTPTADHHSSNSFVRFPLPVYKAMQKLAKAGRRPTTWEFCDAAVAWLRAHGIEVELPPEEE